MVPYVLLGTALLLSLVSPWIHRRVRRHWAERDQRVAAEHRRLQLVNATDWAISMSVRESLNRQVTDWRAPRIMLISAADVTRRAEDDFNLQISREEAHALLMNRLEFRGHLQTTLVTDDHDQQEGTT
ncbi:hypothetical protein [Streptomyces sp. NBC_01197]|uniref:hypothetical protein n=1 Tax=Streptomyces sp. NBC_01197 TaxID=2903768 RepID=UPI002E157DCC|nr:hypothetical protein OG452_34925 [Streptomyces sp. NBC_01197]